MLGGGNALIEKSLAEDLFPRTLGPNTAIHTGQLGYKGTGLFPETAFNRAPTPKLRMVILSRDGRRCRICGRNPDDSSDLVLQVHHIRPWEKGGVTDGENLITLCHTCHAGLEPHFDYSLFKYLPKGPSESIEAYAKDFFEGVANYRKTGFLGRPEKTRKS